MTDCARYRESLGGYVLNALDPGEADALREHLRSCPSCRSEYAELEGLPALLETVGDDAPPVIPPPTLEEAVLDRFARERRGVRPLRRPRRRRLVMAIAAAGAAAVAGLAVAGVFGTDSGDEEFGHVRLTGATGASADADLRAVRAGTGVSLRASGLPTVRGHVYEVWCIRDDGRWISGGTFRADARGRARVTLTSAARPGDYKRMLVTRRPARGGEGLRGPRVLAGRVEY